VFQKIAYHRGGGEMVSAHIHVCTGEDVAGKLPRTQHALSMPGQGSSPRNIQTHAPLYRDTSLILPRLSFPASFSLTSFNTAIQDRRQRHQHTGSIPSIPPDVCIYSAVTSLLGHTPLV